MKWIVIASLLLASNAHVRAESCENNLVPLLRSEQANQLCGTFPTVNINSFYLDQGPNSSTLEGNTAIGEDTARSLTRATVNFNLGNPPVEITAATSATENTAIGEEALRDLRYGSDNTAVGSRALRDNTDAYYNTAIGHYAMGFNKLGWKNTAVGFYALRGTQDASNPHENTAIGSRAMYLAEDAQYNTAVGEDALLLIVDGLRNTAVGAAALQQTLGNNNAAIGQAAGADITSGAANTIVGYESGRGISTGSNNTILGANVGSLAAGLASNIIIANGTGAIKAQHDGTDWTMTGAIAGNSSITSSATGALGWAVVDGTDNTACTSQCTSAAVFGFNLAAGATAPVLVGPSDATADICLCAGAS